MDTEQLVKDEWRELGFYYDHDDRLSVNQWRFYGSKHGLRNLARWLARATKYAGDHVHLGPYCYFTIETTCAQMITERGFLGDVEELEDLSEIIERKIAQTPPGGTFSVDNDYGTNNTVTTKLFVMEDGFDPVSMDELIVSGRQAIVNCTGSSPSPSGSETRSWWKFWR